MRDEVYGWRVRKARLADHTKPGLPVADAREILAEIASGRASDGSTDARAVAELWRRSVAARPSTAESL